MRKKRKPNEIKYNNIASVIIANRGNFDSKFDTFVDGNCTTYSFIQTVVENSKKYNKNYSDEFDFREKSMVKINTILDPQIDFFYTNKETSENMQILRNFLTKKYKRNKIIDLNVNVFLYILNGLFIHLGRVDKIKKEYQNPLSIKYYKHKYFGKRLPEVNHACFLTALFDDTLVQNERGEITDIFRKWKEIPRKGMVNLQKYSSYIENGTNGLFEVQGKYIHQYDIPYITLKDAQGIKYDIKFDVPENNFTRLKSQSELETSVSTKRILIDEFKLSKK